MLGFYFFLKRNDTVINYVNVVGVIVVYCVNNKGDTVTGNRKIAFML